MVSGLRISWTSPPATPRKAARGSARAFGSDSRSIRSAPHFRRAAPRTVGAAGGTPLRAHGHRGAPRLDRGAQSDELLARGRLRGGRGLPDRDRLRDRGLRRAPGASADRLYEIKGRPRSKTMTMMVATGARLLLRRCPDLPASSHADEAFLARATLVVANPEGQMTGFRLPGAPLAAACSCARPAYRSTCPAPTAPGRPRGRRPRRCCASSRTSFHLATSTAARPTEAWPARWSRRSATEPPSAQAPSPRPARPGGHHPLRAPAAATRIAAACRRHPPPPPRPSPRPPGGRGGAGRYQVLSAGTEAREGKSLSLNARTHRR